MALIRRTPRTDPDPEAPPTDNPEPELEVVEPEVVDQLPPSRMRGTEPLYGYVVGLELLVVSVLNLVVRTGKGAPAHPQTALQLLGVAAAVAFFGALQIKSRTIVGFSAIVAGFFVTLPKAPTSLSLAHVLALAGPLAYGLILTQRQRRAMGISGRGARRGRPPVDRGGERGRPATARRASSRRSGKAEAAPSGPRPNARYTPPKTKRSQRRVSGR